MNATGPGNELGPPYFKGRVPSGCRRPWFLFQSLSSSGRQIELESPDVGTVNLPDTHVAGLLQHMARAFM